MVPEIMDGISLALKRAFGDDVEIYFSNDGQEGLKEPCFVLSVKRSSRTKRIGNRYRQRNSFRLAYHPAGKPGDAEMMDVAERLLDALEFIRLADGDLIHGTSMAYRIVDGVLRFSVDFNLFLKKEPEIEEMETVEIHAIHENIT